MMERPTISIIIATFNRGSEIIDTLASISAQMYKGWECIIIDDGSTDDTRDRVTTYIEKDHRFTYLDRPAHIKKGANACRNYGFTLSKGSYIKFFDSDDLMLPQHLGVSLDVTLSRKLDFVVSDCQNFDENGLQERPYETDKNNIIITAEDFAMFRNGWITNDLLVTREFAEKIKFNEEVRDLASEYQYCIRLLLLTQNGLLIPDILTHRRVHAGSIFVQMTNDDLKWKSLTAENKLYTAVYVQDIAPRSLIRWLLSGYMQYSFDIALSGQWPLHTVKGTDMVIKYFSFSKGMLLPVAYSFGYSIKKGYNLIKYIRKT